MPPHPVLQTTLTLYRVAWFDHTTKKVRDILVVATSKELAIARARAVHGGPKVEFEGVVELGPLEDGWTWLL